MIMKKTAIISLIMAISVLTASCGKSPAESSSASSSASSFPMSASSENSSAESSTVSVSSSDPISGQLSTTSGYIESERLFQIGTTISEDLNGDGDPEKIYYGSDDFRINDVSYKDQILKDVYENNPAEGDFCITDINQADSRKEIGLRAEGSVNGPTVFFFTLIEDKLVSLGSVTTIGEYFELIYDGKGKVSGDLKLDILQTWWARADWVLTDGNRLEPVPGEIYYPYPYTEYPVTLKVSLPIYKNPGDSESIGQIKPQAVTLTATDNAAWCRIEGADGVAGWFRVTGFSTIADLSLDASAVFDNLFIQ
ncbi:MAG: SH3 domain-containing protein [Saccharofermentanales bacterium]